MRAITIHPAVAAITKQLSTTEVVLGLIHFSGYRSFPEQALYRFCGALETAEGSRRFGIVRDSLGRLSSSSLQQTITFFEIGQILQPSLDNVCRPRRSHRDAVANNLAERGVLPQHENTLRTLAQTFVRSLQ